VLRALGYVVNGANSGAAAVDILRKERFDMMVVDYNMPGVTEFEASMLGELAQEPR
jgi:CheY-like chemotaxis protein